MMYQREENASDMGGRQDYGQAHCYTNPSFCRQSEYMAEDAGNSSGGSDLPPPPQFQPIDDLPPPPDTPQAPPAYGSDGGQVNHAFHGSPEVDLDSRHRQPPTQPRVPQPLQRQHSIAGSLNHTTADRYCYIDESADQPSPGPAPFHKRYGSLPMGRAPPGYGYHQRAVAAATADRYEYIQDDANVQLQVHCQSLQQQQVLATPNGSRYEYIEQQQLQQRCSQQGPPPPPALPQRQQQMQQQQPQAQVRPVPVKSYRSVDGHYAPLPIEASEQPVREAHWQEDEAQAWNAPRRQIDTPKGRYTSVPMQEEYPPSLPDRNNDSIPGQRVNNVATQKLHEILTTPRKPRKRSQSEALSPVRTPQQHTLVPTHRGNLTPGCSPSSAAGHRSMNSPMRPQQQHQQQQYHQQQAGQHQQQQQQQQQQSTPQNRALSPRRAGPMTSTPNKEPPSARRCLPLNETPGPLMLRRHLDDSHIAYGRTPPHRQPPPRYHQSSDSVAQEAMYVEHKKAPNGFYQDVEAAFAGRTAVVPPLSSPTSEANTTLISNTEKYERRSAPLLLILVGILTSGLAIYLSYTQGRWYYYDSAFICGACCALAGASRSLRRTWTGLGLAGLAALSCAGLLLLAIKTPRPGTPLHDVTAGALCGVSLLGAALAFLALVSPRCTFGRHHRVHSWIPKFTP